jgi:hypothetical protein
MNFAIVIIGAGALLLIATTMYRNGRDDDDSPFGDDETGFLPRERIAPPIAFEPVFRIPSAPSVPTIPSFEGVDPDYFGE